LQSSPENRILYMKLVLDHLDQRFLHKNDWIHNLFDNSDCDCDNCDLFMRCEVTKGFDMIDQPISIDQRGLMITVIIIAILMAIGVIIKICELGHVRRNNIFPIEYVE
jgi:hypothetical protein